MYLIPIEVKDSSINGKGVFAVEKILKGTIVWKYNSEHDKAISIDEYNHLSETKKLELDRVSYLSALTNRYVFPPENDPAEFTNHSKDNNLTVAIDRAVSEEPYFVANKDIEVEEEITNNYEEFDEALKTYKPEWV